MGVRPGPLTAALDRVDAMRPIAQRLGVPVPTLALRWALEQRGVTAAIAGSRNADHTAGNAEAGRISLDADVLRELDGLFSR